MKIFDKNNTQVLEQNINGDVFIAAQSEDGACAIIEHVDKINADILEQMKELVNADIVKIVGKQSDYDIIKPALSMIFENVKFVKREVEYQIFFNPGEKIIRASKFLVNKIVEKGNPVEEIQKIVKVLVVDDSTTICNLLTKIMSLSPHIEVVGTINNPLDADQAIIDLKPDVVTLDIHMPHLNGVELLKQISPKHQVPCIMISSISMQEGPLVLEALESGAVDYIQKPDMSNFAAIANEINTKIISASKAHIVKEKSNSFVKKASSSDVELDSNLILIGASTGGTRALKEVLDNLPDTIPPILIVQHIPAEFSKAFAERLDRSTKFKVKEAVDGDLVVANQVLVAPGGTQMKFVHRGGLMKVEINDDAPVNRFKPSVDYLFDSVSNSSVEKNIVAAIFTGMGKDGAEGMKRLKTSKGAKTIAQNEESSVVFGMPKEAIRIGAADHVVALSDAADILMDSCRFESSKKAQ